MEESYILLPPSDELQFGGMFVRQMVYLFKCSDTSGGLNSPGGDISPMASSVMQSCISKKMEQVAKISEYRYVFVVTVMK